MKKILLLTAFLFAIAGLGQAQTIEPSLLQKPTLSRSQIVFAYAGDLWIVGRDGGTASRLTTGTGVETDPKFSPDGSLIAFTGEYDGNVDVYVVPATGGVPRRLTYHPGTDLVTAWTPDGKQILFRSPRISTNPVPKLFTVPVEGGFPTEVSLPMGVSGSYSADGSRLAYVPTIKFQDAWKQYRGGQTTPIWIASLSDSSVEKLPRDNSNDSNPMWVGDKLYFLSDRSGSVSLFAYDTNSKKVTQLVKNDGLDIKSAEAGPGGIVFEQFGSIHLYDFASARERKLNITVSGDLPGVRPHVVKVARNLSAPALSPTGARAMFQARG